jgi:hypothetical protein
MKRLVRCVSLGALAFCAMGSLAAGQGTMAPMRPVQMPQVQQMPPAATGTPRQLGRPCNGTQYPNAAQQLGAQYGPNQVYPGYLSGTGGMPGGSGVPGMGGTPGTVNPNAAGDSYYGGYGPQANNAAPNSQVPCPPR